MKVLVIGGSGNISPAIVDELINMGHEVSFFNRGHHFVPEVRRITGDRTDIPGFIAEMMNQEFKEFQKHPRYGHQGCFSIEKWSNYI